MNRKNYRIVMLCVCAAAFVITGSAFYCAYYPDAGVAQCWVQVMALALSIPASIAVTATEQRREFTESVREAWPGVVESVHKAIDFTHKPTPGSWEAAITAMSRTIDNVRVVFGNVGANRKKRGLYPVEALHRINKRLNALGPAPQPPLKYIVARKLFVRNMKRCQAVWSAELGGTVPSHPDTFGRPIRV